MKYSVVVVTYNRLELLKQCISCIRDQSLKASEIIVVDNASTDGTGEYLDGLKADGVRIFHQTSNLGGSGGFRAGLEEAVKSDTDYVLIIDDDAMIAPDYLEVCDRYLSEHPGCAACSGTVITDGIIQLNHRRTIRNELIFLENNVSEAEYKKDSFEYELSTFCGLMVKRRIIEEIGLPKSEYFICYDDTEYSMRLKKYGPIINLNRAVLDHKTTNTTDVLGFFDRMSWKTYYTHRNRYDMVKNHCPKPTAFMVWWEFIPFIIGAELHFLNTGDKEKGRYVVELLRNARKDGRRGILGKNPKYQRS